MTDPTSLPPGRARELALRAQRKSEALRANLRRRKDQTRARSTAEDATLPTDVVAVSHDGAKSGRRT